jgi:ATP-dependent DNA ligase
MERSHIDTTWKQNTMQMFLLTGAFLVKLDGYRTIAIRDDNLQLLSRRNNVLNQRFRSVAEALKAIAPGTILDGEVVALD